MQPMASDCASSPDQTLEGLWCHTVKCKNLPCFLSVNVLAHCCLLLDLVIAVNNSIQGVTGVLTNTEHKA